MTSSRPSSFVQMHRNKTLGLQDWFKLVLWAYILALKKDSFTSRWIWQCRRWFFVDIAWLLIRHYICEWLTTDTDFFLDQPSISFEVWWSWCFFSKASFLPKHLHVWEISNWDQRFKFFSGRFFWLWLSLFICKNCKANWHIINANPSLINRIWMINSLVRIVCVCKNFQLNWRPFDLHRFSWSICLYLRRRGN